MVVFTCHPICIGSINKIVVQACPVIKQDSFLKITKAKRNGVMAQVIERLLATERP
jgi:hypothetical protein